MSTYEKQNTVSLLSNILVTLPYIIFVVNKYGAENPVGQQELKFWAAAILLLLPLRIVTQIIVYIFFTILNAIVTGEHEIKEVIDERDKLIELKGDRFATNTLIWGLMLSLVAILLGGSASVMFLILLVGGFIGEVIGIFTKIYFYRKGL